MGNVPADFPFENQKRLLMELSLDFVLVSLISPFRLWSGYKPSVQRCAHSRSNDSGFRSVRQTDIHPAPGGPEAGGPLEFLFPAGSKSKHCGRKSCRRER